jgi:hemerythrin-like domain-containing protein
MITMTGASGDRGRTLAHGDRWQYLPIPPRRLLTREGEDPMKNATRHPIGNFDEPLRALQATHLRIELRLALLAELCQHVRCHGNDESARTTAGVVLRYFDDSEATHQADEEVDLFPALAAAADPAGRKVLEQLLKRLSVQHREIERSYSAVRPYLMRLASGQSGQLPADLCTHLHDLYMQHISIEEDELLPLAERSLAPEVLQRIGAAMAARRAPEPVCA